MTGGRLDRQGTGVRRLTDDKGDSLGQLTDNRCVRPDTSVTTDAGAQTGPAVSFKISKQPLDYSQGVGENSSNDANNGKPLISKQ